MNFIKKFRFFTLLFFAFPLFFSSVKASSPVPVRPSPDSSGISLDEQNKMMPIYPQQNAPFFGQNHTYSVTFRGNGEAVVAVRIALTNTNDKGDLKEVSLRFPKGDPRDIVVYQIIGQGYCIRYTSDMRTIAGNEVNRCVEYSDPDYYGYLYNSKYQKARFDYSGDTLKVSLPVAIVPQKSGSFFVYYRSSAYTSKSLTGAYSYNFETLKVDDSINRLTIGISTDTDLYLKGGKGKVEYRNEVTSLSLKGAPVADSAAASPALDRFVSQIGQGTITKEASDLASMESYKVKGVYADSIFKLYGREIGIILTVFLVIIILMVLAARIMIRRGSFRKKTSAKAASSENVEELTAAVPADNIRLFFGAMGLSFVSAFIMAAYLFGVIIILMGLDNGIVIDYQLAPFFRFALGVLTFIVLLILLLAPSIYYGYKKGIGWGILNAVLFIGWMFLLFVVFLFLMYFPSQSSRIMNSGVAKPVDAVRAL